MSSATGDSAPIKPARLRVQLEETTTGLALRYRQRQWGGGLFMMLWLCGWTVGCVFMAVQLWNKPELMLFVFAVPFWASWFFAAGLLLTMFLTLEVLNLDEVGASYAKTVLVPIHRRTIPLDELIKFVASQTQVKDGESAAVSYVELITLGQPLLMFPNLRDDERRWITWRLNQQLRSLNPAEGRDESPAFTDHPSTEPPSDSVWACEESYEGSKFVRRGRFSLAGLLGALFINLFWNGIVSVFLMALFGFGPEGPQQFGIGWWGMFLFLIPFEAIGLVMVVALFAVLLEPVHWTTWRFNRDEIALRDSWLGIGRTRRYDASSVTRVLLEIHDAATTSRNPLDIKQFHPTAQTTASRDCQLRLIDRDNVEILSLTGLTEGEARWMMANLERDNPTWFR